MEMQLFFYLPIFHCFGFYGLKGLKDVMMSETAVGGNLFHFMAFGYYSKTDSKEQINTEKTRKVFNQLVDKLSKVDKIQEHQAVIKEDTAEGTIILLLITIQRKILPTLMVTRMEIYIDKRYKP